MTDPSTLKTHPCKIRNDGPFNPEDPPLRLILLVDLKPKTKVVRSRGDFRSLKNVRNAFVFRGIKHDLRRGIPEWFYGWKPGAMAAEMIAMTSMILDKAAEFEIPLLAVKIDLHKFFDSLRYEHMMKAMITRGIAEAISTHVIRDFATTGCILAMPTK